MTSEWHSNKFSHFWSFGFEIAVAPIAYNTEQDLEQNWDNCISSTINIKADLWVFV